MRLGDLHEQPLCARRIRPRHPDHLPWYMRQLLAAGTTSYASAPTLTSSHQPHRSSAVVQRARAWTHATPDRVATEGLLLMPDPIEPFLTASADSTPLSPSRLQLVGGGSNLIVVPSSLDETSGWLPVAEALTEHRVWLLDRSEPLEQEDRAIDALADTIIRAILSLGGIPAVFAHGSGAIALLQALITEPDLP